MENETTLVLTMKISYRSRSECFEKKLDAFPCMVILYSCIVICVCMYVNSHVYIQHHLQANAIISYVITWCVSICVNVHAFIYVCMCIRMYN